MIHDQFCIMYAPILFFASLSAEMLFLDDDENDSPTDLASFPTTKCCLRGDDGRLCSSRFMAFPRAYRERYGVPRSVELVGFMDCFDR